MHHCWSYWLKLACDINACSYLNNLIGRLSASHDSRDTITRPSAYGCRLAGIWPEKYTVRFRKITLKVQFHSSKLDPHAASMNVLMSDAKSKDKRKAKKSLRKKLQKITRNKSGTHEDTGDMGTQTDKSTKSELMTGLEHNLNKRGHGETGEKWSSWWSGENSRIKAVLTRLLWDRWAGKGRENRRQEVVSHTWHKRISSAK